MFASTSGNGILIAPLINPVSFHSPGPLTSKNTCLSIIYYYYIIPVSTFTSQNSTKLTNLTGASAPPLFLYTSKPPYKYPNI